jgi:hypothetical protein
MADEALATYLGNHLAGSTGALELMDHLRQSEAGAPVAGELTALRDEVTEERRILEDLIGELGASESRPRQAVAWLGEKLSRLKLELDDPGEGALHLLEGLEAITVALEGKRALWQTLTEISGAYPELRALDLTNLIERTDQQRRMVETLRLRAASAAFRGGP